MSRLATCLIALASLLEAPLSFAQIPQESGRDTIDLAFRNFFAADSPTTAEHYITPILKTDVTFDDALRQLQQGRHYADQKTGVIQLSNRTADGVEHTFTVNVPATYNPARRYQVRFQLHGGIDDRSDGTPRGRGDIGTLAGAEQIYVLPYAWDRAPWWSDDQILNLNAIIDSLKRTYNVDENRVVLSGVSDGATGAYFIAMSDTTPFASFLPLNGFILVLSIHPEVEGRLFPNNLTNKPLFVVNGGKDPIYPSATVEPFTRHLMAGGVQIDYHPQPEGAHNTRWWPEVRDTYEKFVADHPRDPQPSRLTWEAADLAHNRAHWLIINAFGDIPGHKFDEGTKQRRGDVPQADSHRPRRCCANREHRRSAHKRRLFFHPALVSGQLRLEAAGESHCQWQGGIRRARFAKRANIT